MSTLSVTTVTTGLSTTNLTLNTANTGAGDIVIQSDGLGMVLSGNSTTNTIDLAPNGHVAIANSTVNTFVLTSAGQLDIGGTIRATKQAIPSSGAGIELIYYLGAGYVASYDRTAATYNPLQLQGNTIYLVANGTAAVTVAPSGTVTIASNTLTLGTSSAAASPGWTYLPNGLKMVWGTIIANTISSATFTSAFPTACLSVSVTPITASIYIGANTIYVSGVTASAATIRSASQTTSATAYYTAIGY